MNFIQLCILINILVIGISENILEKSDNNFVQRVQFLRQKKNINEVTIKKAPKITGEICILFFLNVKMFMFLKIAFFLENSIFDNNLGLHQCLAENRFSSQSTKHRAKRSTILSHLLKSRSNPGLFQDVQKIFNIRTAIEKEPKTIKLDSSPRSRLTLLIPKNNEGDHENGPDKYKSNFRFPDKVESTGIPNRGKSEKTTNRDFPRRTLKTDLDSDSFLSLSPEKKKICTEKDTSRKLINNEKKIDESIVDENNSDPQSPEIFEEKQNYDSESLVKDLKKKQWDWKSDENNYEIMENVLREIKKQFGKMIENATEDEHRRSNYHVEDKIIDLASKAMEDVISSISENYPSFSVPRSSERDLKNNFCDTRTNSGFDYVRGDSEMCRCTANVQPFYNYYSDEYGTCPKCGSDKNLCWSANSDQDDEFRDFEITDRPDHLFYDSNMHHIQHERPVSILSSRKRQIRRHQDVLITSHKLRCY